MNRPYWRNEHPEADLDDLPIPADWEDLSWKNDVCSSFLIDGILRVWIDYADPERREFGPDSPRYSVVMYGEDWHAGDEVGQTDDFGELAAILEEGRRLWIREARNPTTEKVQAIATMVYTLFENPALDLTLSQASEHVANWLRPGEMAGSAHPQSMTHTQWVEFLGEAGFDYQTAERILSEAKGV